MKSLAGMLLQKTVRAFGLRASVFSRKYAGKALDKI